MKWMGWNTEDLYNASYDTVQEIIKLINEEQDALNNG